MVEQPENVEQQSATVTLKKNLNKYGTVCCYYCFTSEPAELLPNWIHDECAEKREARRLSAKAKNQNIKQEDSGDTK